MKKNSSRGVAYVLFIVLLASMNLVLLSISSNIIMTQKLLSDIYQSHIIKQKVLIGSQLLIKNHLYNKQCEIKLSDGLNAQNLLPPKPSCYFTFKNMKFHYIYIQIKPYPCVYLKKTKQAAQFNILYGTFYHKEKRILVQSLFLSKAVEKIRCPPNRAPKFYPRGLLKQVIIE